MPRLLVQADAQPVDLRRWASAVPLLIARLRELAFDEDGVVRLPSGRREGLRIVDGTPGRAGATYRLVTWETTVDAAGAKTRTAPSAPATVTVEHDDNRELRLVIGTAELEARVRIEDPGSPLGAYATMTTRLPPDLPVWLGQVVELEGTLDVSDSTRPVLRAQGRMRRATASATIEHADGRLRADLAVRLKGPLAFAGVLWPFLAGSARRSVTESLTPWWSDVAVALSPERSPADAVDQVMADLERDLVEHVPA